jgi:hypothetical protein
MVWALFFSLMLLPFSLSFFIDNQSLKYVFLLINLLFSYHFVFDDFNGNSAEKSPFFIICLLLKND